MFPFDEYAHGYELCNDTVSVYHFDGEGVTRTVYPNAMLDFKKNLNVERTGSTEANGFLLVVPGGFQACRVGDKVMLGEGEEVPAEGVAAWWRTFIPSKVDGLVVVRHVDVKRFGGRIVHTEAGG